MQLEITLKAAASDPFVPSDLGYLLHKNPARVFSRAVSSGVATVFYSENSAVNCTAVLYVDVDPIALVRGKHKQTTGLLDQYVNTRPFVANSILSVAINKCFSQTMAGKSKSRQTLADQKLPFEVTLGPVACQGDKDFVLSLFEPLGFTCTVTSLGDDAVTKLYSIQLSASVRLSDLLNQLYVLIPVLDNSKHWWVDQDEVDNLFKKGACWLAQHPMREKITRRALKNRRELADVLLDRLSELDGEQCSDWTQIANATGGVKPARIEVSASNDAPVRLHEQRLDRVTQLLQEHSVSRVLDLGCGEGKLVSRLQKKLQFTNIVGVDPSLRSLRRARELFYLEDGGQALNERLQFQLGSLTYADRRLRGFDAATLIEVIEHIDTNRLGSLERSLFGDARPRVIIVTTPNADYNAKFQNLSAGEFRHEDHRFEWSRNEFAAWCQKISKKYAYQVTIEALGPVDEQHGSPSQLASFTIDTMKAKTA